MGAPKGHIGNPNGRPVGAVNKTTATAREAIAKFVEGNAERLVGWLDRIAEDDPKAAFNCFMDVVEYHIPKLARTELVGDKNAPVQINLLKFGDDPSILEKISLLQQREKSVTLDNNSIPLSPKDEQNGR